MAKLVPNKAAGRGVYDVRLMGPRREGEPRLTKFQRFYGEKRDVQKRADAWEREVRATWERGTSPTLTLADYWRARIESGAWTRASTIQDKWTHYQWATEDGFADAPLVDITPADVQAHVAWFEARRTDRGARQPMAPKTVLQHRGALREMFRAAVKDGALAASPADDTTVARRPAKRNRARLPTVAAVRAAMDELELPAWFIMLIELAMGTGMRRGEMLGLQWGDLERHENGTAHLHVLRQARNRTHAEAKAGGVPTVVVTPELKTDNSYRQVLIHAGTVAQLDTYRASVEAIAEANGIAPTSPHWPTRADRFIFSMNWETPASPAYATVRWGKLRRKVGLPASFRLHDLRHLHATDLIDNGATFPDVAARLGDTVQTVIDAYVHSTAAGEQRAAEIVGRLMFAS